MKKDKKTKTQLPREVTDTLTRALCLQRSCPEDTGSRPFLKETGACSQHPSSMWCSSVDAEAGGGPWPWAGAALLTPPSTAIPMQSNSQSDTVTRLTNPSGFCVTQVQCGRTKSSRKSFPHICLSNTRTDSDFNTAKSRELPGGRILMFPMTITYDTPACISFSSSYENTHLKM